MRISVDFKNHLFFRSENVDIIYKDTSEKDYLLLGLDLSRNRYRERNRVIHPSIYKKH